MFLSVLLMAGMAYLLSKRGLAGKRFISFYIYFTTLFSGGLVPTYILNTQYLHLDDTIWIYIIPGLISPFYVFIMRSFFQDIPYEITESAVIDGANEYTIFFRMILPLSKPVLAAVALFMFLAKWNDWMTSMLYINKEELISLQYMLQRIMENIKLLQNQSQDLGFNILAADEIPAELDKFRSEINEFNEQDEDVLSYALFGPVATKFFEFRQAEKYKIDPTLGDKETKVHPM